jgi:hypothetical protein
MKRGRPIIEDSIRQRAIRAGMLPHDYKSSIDPEYKEYRKAVLKKSYLKYRDKRIAAMKKYNEYRKLCLDCGKEA